MIEFLRFILIDGTLIKMAQNSHYFFSMMIHIYLFVLGEIIYTLKVYIKSMYIESI